MGNKKILIGILLAYTSLASQPADNQKIDEEKSRTAGQEFRRFALNTIMVQTFMGWYSFQYGVILGGRVLAKGESPVKSSAWWMITPLMGGGLGWIAGNDLSKEFLSGLRSNANIEKSDVRYYQSVNLAPSMASIIDFKAESIYSNEDGGPLWTASTPEVDVVMTLPSLGYRLGTHGQRFGWEFEISLNSHHTKKQTVTYDAEGEIYYNELGIYIPIQLSQIEIPDRFLLLHSLYYGGNVYFLLPRFGVQPYLGLGAGVLFNSVQSQYPGPANLTQQSGELALDSVTNRWGIHALIGVRAHLKNNRFVYAEFQPARHFFKYESGSGQLQEVDEYTLQIFQVQLGIGFYFF